MHMISLSDPRNFPALTCKLLLGACWIAGLLFGMYAAVASGNSLLLMMRGDVSTVSIPGLLIISLPFLLTAVAVFLSHPGVLVPMVLWEAFGFGFCAYGFVISFGGAYWLAWLLLMFPRVAAVPLLMWLWLRCCEVPNRYRIGEIAACGAAVALVGVVDHCLIAPCAAVLF